jgi:hypothetical protein
MLDSSDGSTPRGQVYHGEIDTVSKPHVTDGGEINRHPSHPSQFHWRAGRKHAE